MDFFWTYLWPLIITIAECVLMLVVLLIAIAYILLADRKIWAAVQIRRGPNVVGPWGLFQSFADLLKFMLKEPVIPAGANKGVFLLAPLVTCVLALAAWGVIRPCRQGRKIGPLVADDRAAAEAVLSALLARAAGGEIFLDVPSVNREAIALAESFGLAPVFETARMYTGPIAPLRVERVFGVTSFELG